MITRGIAVSNNCMTKGRRIRNSAGGDLCRYCTTVPLSSRCRWCRYRVATNQAILEGTEVQGYFRGCLLRRFAETHRFIAGTGSAYITVRLSVSHVLTPHWRTYFSVHGF